MNSILLFISAGLASMSALVSAMISAADTT